MTQVNIDEPLRLAVEHHQAGRLAEAEALYRQVLAIDASQPDALHLLGVLANQVKRPDAAVGLIRQAIALRPEWPEAYNHLGNALKEQGKLQEALAAYDQALFIHPKFAEAHLNRGNAVLELGQLQEAMDCYRRALDIKPDYSDAYNNVGNIFKGQGQLDESIRAYRRAHKYNPRNVEALSNLGNALKEQGKLEEAIETYERGLAIQPLHAACLMNLGNAFVAHGQPDAGINCYQRALRAHPQSPEVHYHVGNLYRGEGWPEKAIEAYLQALELRPNYLDALLALATVLQQTRQLDQAIAVLRQALSIRPDHPEALLNLGSALHETNQTDKAMEAYERALVLRPDYPDAILNIGNLYKEQGQSQKALEAYRRALTLRPQFAEAYYNLGNTLKNIGQISEAVEAYRRALEIRPSYADAHTNLLFTLHDLSEPTPESLFAEARRWNEIHAEPLRGARQPHANDRAPDRRLKIGYVSADFRTHSCAFFSGPLLAHHDHEAFEIFCYAQVSKPDAVTESFRSCAEHWISTIGMTDTALAQRIRDDRIDILVDMMGHTGGNRLLALAHKPAPVQVTYLGYPDTTGLTSMDYRLTDAQADPKGITEALHSETLVRLADTFLCYQPSTPILPVNDLPAARGAAFTFASFNDIGKISNVTVDLWAKILTRLPQARLLLKTKNLSDAAAGDHLRQRFSNVGIAPERLDLRGNTPSIAEHLAFYHQVDLALDPFPYSGTTTTCEALYMGVPVVTLAGCAHVSRVGTTLLSVVGLPELIAATPEEYVEKAVALAQDLPKLAAWRADLRGRMENSPLMDAPGFARKVEAAYREMWHKWCAQTADAKG